MLTAMALRERGNFGCRFSRSRMVHGIATATTLIDFGFDFTLDFALHSSHPVRTARNAVMSAHEHTTLRASNS